MLFSFSKNNVVKILSSTVLNVIPNKKAASLIFTAGVNSGNWARFNPLSYESTIKDDIHIIGNSQGTGQPKAGHIGNSEAKVCADAILRTLNGLSQYPSPKTNSACYSLTSSTEASWLTAVYKYVLIQRQWFQLILLFIQKQEVHLLQIIKRCLLGQVIYFLIHSIKTNL